ncbi:MAG: sigma-54-dependent transcriptional regulator, partial [Planctomycetota bacterium]
MNAGPVPSLEGLRVLVVDDEPDICLGLQKLIGSLGAEVLAAGGGCQALEIVERPGADLVLTDLMMPGMSGSELLLEVKKRSPATPVVILTGFGTIQTAVSCLQNGATHFLTKPFDNHEILGLVGRLGRQIFASRRRHEAEPWLAERMVVRSPRMRGVLELVDRVASSPVSVLIEGESGTGKELIARRIHARSFVRERPFLAVNAAALPDT